MIENLRMETPVNKSDQLGSRLGMCNKTGTPTWFVAGEVILCGSATTRHQVEVRTALENANWMKKRYIVWMIIEKIPKNGQRWISNTLLVPQIFKIGT